MTNIFIILISFFLSNLAWSADFKCWDQSFAYGFVQRKLIGNEFILELQTQDIAIFSGFLGDTTLSWGEGKITVQMKAQNCKQHSSENLIFGCYSGQDTLAAKAEIKTWRGAKEISKQIDLNLKYLLVSGSVVQTETPDGKTEVLRFKIEGQEEVTGEWRTLSYDFPVQRPKGIAECTPGF